MITEDAIIKFGFPDSIKNLKPQICFEDQSVFEQFIKNGCHCKPDSTKFFIYTPKNQEPIFTMSFDIRNHSHNSRAFDTKVIDEPHIGLQHLSTHKPFRNQGIASFYLKQLCKFCIENGLRSITLNVAPDSSEGLNQNELVKFYNNFSSDEIEIIFI